MKKRFIVPLVVSILLSGSLIACSSNSSSNGRNEELIILPDVFKNTNFAHAGGQNGVYLYLDEKNNPDIHNVNFHLEDCSVEFELKPMRKKDAMYFLVFTVTDPIMDDGYLKRDVTYKFWLSYENDEFYAGISKDDDTLTEPELIMMEGLL